MKFRFKALITLFLLCVSNESHSVQDDGPPTRVYIGHSSETLSRHSSDSWGCENEENTLIGNTYYYRSLNDINSYEDPLQRHKLFSAGLTCLSMGMQIASAACLLTEFQRRFDSQYCLLFTGILHGLGASINVTRAFNELCDAKIQCHLSQSSRKALPFLTYTFANILILVVIFNDHNRSIPLSDTMKAGILLSFLSIVPQALSLGGQCHVLEG